MGNLTHFESRTVRVTHSPETVYNFATDIRNFRRFIPDDNFTEIVLEQDSCSFRVNTLGTVNVQLKEKTMFNKIVFAGNALMQTDFFIKILLNEAQNGESEIKILFEAEMNPMFRMVATAPVKQFLDTLANEIERFRGWKDII